MPLGLAVAFKILARYTDGTVQDVTAQATLALDDPSVSALDGQLALRGLLAGRTTLRACFAGLTIAAPVEVTPPVLQAIEISGADASVARGSLLRFRATGVRTDGVTLDLTDAVTWSSDDTQLAYVSSCIAPGAVLAWRVGTVIIRATDPATLAVGTFELTIHP